MSAYNGWQDQPETERESIEIWEASTKASLTPVMLYRIASNVSLSQARSAYDAAQQQEAA